MRERIMSVAKTKTSGRAVIDAENERNLAAFEEFISPSYVNSPQHRHGSKGYTRVLTMLFTAFPDGQETMEDLIAEGDQAGLRLRIETGTHTGEFKLFGISAALTGKQSTVKPIYIWRIVDDKIVVQDAVADELDLLRQMGLSVPPEKGKSLFPKD